MTLSADTDLSFHIMHSCRVVPLGIKFIPADDYTCMDPKPRHTFCAPGHAAAPGVHEGPFPGVDDHIVRPETREEMVRGELILAQPAEPPRADCHARLDYVTATHVRTGYIVSSHLLTRFGLESDFATDVCVRKAGTDPETGNRYLEELAFEIVDEQSLHHITIRAEDIAARGVRRLIVIFVEPGTVTEWSSAEHRFVPLPLDGVLEDPTLAQPIPIRAMLDTGAARQAVAAAVWAQDDNPWILARKQELSQRARPQGREEGRAQGRQDSLLVILEARGLHPSEDQRATIESCSDPERLQRWLRAAVRVGSVAELLESSPGA
jgi:hypothetical protein